MPVYEFQCQDCQQKSSFFIKTITMAEIAPVPVCPFCNGNLSRLPSTFAYTGETGEVLPPPPELSKKELDDIAKDVGEKLGDARKVLDKFD